MESRLSATELRVLLVAVAVITAIATHLVDRAAAPDVTQLRAQEIKAASEWLDQFYSSAEGLQRAGGLCAAGRVDHDAITQWLFDSYLQSRMRGATPDEAKASIIAAIRQSGEWREKHPQ